MAGPLFAAVPVTGVARFVAADGTSAKTLLTAGTSGTRIEQIIIASTNAAPIRVSFTLTKSGVTVLLGRVDLAAVRSGDAVQRFPLKDWLGESADQSLSLASGDVLAASVDVAVASGAAVDVTVFGGNY